MLDAGRVERAIERVAHLGRNALVGAAVDGEDRAGEARRLVGRGRQAGAVRPGRPPIEADDAAQAEPRPRLEEAHPPAEAEAGGVEPLGRAAVGRAQVLNGRGDVVHHPLCGQLHDVRLILEALATATRLGGPAEEIDGHGMDAGLGKAKGELVVVRVEPADVGQDHDAGARWRLGAGP